MEITNSILKALSLPRLDAFIEQTTELVDQKLKAHDRQDREHSPYGKGISRQNYDDQILGNSTKDWGE